MLQCAAVCCSVLQCAAVCCSVLQCAAVCCSILQYAAVCCIVGCGASCQKAITFSPLAKMNIKEKIHRQSLHDYFFSSWSLVCGCLQSLSLSGKAVCVAVCCGVVQGGEDS